MGYRIKIFDTLGEKILVTTLEGEFSRKTVLEQDSVFVEMNTDNNETLKKGGPFDLEVSLLDAEGNELYHRNNMRWLIEYGQIIGRLSVDSGRNFYKSGDALEVSANVPSINGVGKTVVAELHIVGGWGFDQIFSKEVMMETATQIISFNDVASERVKVKEIDLVIKDKETGIVLDTYNMDVKYFRKYGVDSYDGYILLGLIVILVGLFVYLKRNNKFGYTMMLVAIFLPSVMLFGGQQKAEAFCICSGGQPTANFWVSKEPITPTCGKTATMDVTLRVQSFPIKGREISRANRGELLDFFKALLK